MAVKKMRGITVDLWTDEKIVALSPLARLLFIGSWHYCCDQGHLGSTPMELKMRVLPADNCDIYALVEEIVAQGLYRRDEEGRLSVPNLAEHQRLDKRYLISCERCGPTGEPHEDHEGDTGGARGDHAGTTRAPRAEGERKVKGSEGEGGTPRQRGSRLPDIFPITEAMREWGREHAPDIDASREHEKFRDYWRSASGKNAVKRDWIAAWRNWMRRAQEDAEKRRPPAPTPRKPEDNPFNLPESWLEA